jgi:hypothetical protein
VVAVVYNWFNPRPRLTPWPQPTDGEPAATCPAPRHPDKVQVPDRVDNQATAMEAAIEAAVANGEP